MQLLLATTYTIHTTPFLMNPKYIVSIVIVILLAWAITMTVLYALARKYANFRQDGLAETHSPLTTREEVLKDEPYHFIYGYNPSRGECPTCYCAYESALLHSERKVHVYVKGSVQDFKDFGGWFSSLDDSYQKRLVFFNFTTPEDLYDGTPFEGFHLSDKYTKDSDEGMKSYHIADSGRLAAVYKQVTIS